MSLNIPQQIFVLFYAIFWGTVASTLPRWKAFAFPYVFHNQTEVKQTSQQRVVLSILMLNLVPILFFVCMLKVLTGPAWEVRAWGWSATLRITAGLVAAFAIFAFYRFWLWAVLSRREAYYWPLDADAALFKQLYPGLSANDLDPRWARGNLLFALFYLVIVLLAVLGVSFGFRAAEAVL